MAFTKQETAELQKKIDRHLRDNRPPEKIRHQLDIICRLKGQSVLLYEVRPDWQDSNKFIEMEVAKASFVRNRAIWKIYWMRGNLKWAAYDPCPVVGDLDLFFKEVETDKFGCFYG